ncbi:MAG: hypothetical protein HY007_04245 [Candidatus Sungbacteria bacterium]|nr:hypothetical protein [Candidatus Sungbacteria bacterium]
MSHISDTAKNIFAGFGIIAFLLIAPLFVVAMWRAPIHQFNLWTLGRNFSAINSHHPEDSRYVLRVRDFGNLFRGASNGCDYLVGEVRAGKGSQEEIARYYRGIFIKSFDGINPVPIEVRFFDKENLMDPYPWSDWRDKAQSYIDPVSLDGTLYMVFARQDSYPPYGDIRCN